MADADLFDLDALTVLEDKPVNAEMRGEFMRTLSLAVAVVLVGCDMSDQRPRLRSTARIVQPVSVASKATGLDCSLEGSSVCLPGLKGETGLCFAFGPGLRADGTEPGGYVCTHTCQTDADCEEELSCRAVVAGDTKVCMPHRDFVAKVAQPRGKPRPPPATAQPAPPGGSPVPAMAMDGGVR